MVDRALFGWYVVRAGEEWARVSLTPWRSRDTFVPFASGGWVGWGFAVGLGVTGAGLLVGLTVAGGVVGGRLVAGLERTQIL